MKFVMVQMPGQIYFKGGAQETSPLSCWSSPACPASPISPPLLFTGLCLPFWKLPFHPQPPASSISCLILWTSHSKVSRSTLSIRGWGCICLTFCVASAQLRSAHRSSLWCPEDLTKVNKRPYGISWKSGQGWAKRGSEEM